MATSTTKISIIAPEDVDLFTFRLVIDAEADEFAEEDAQKTIKEPDGKPRDKEYHEFFGLVAVDALITHLFSS